jgi:hypothetical protein
MITRVPKFEEIQTFNHAGKAYHVKDLNAEQLELLQVYVSVEEEIFNHKLALSRSQHALNSVSNLFKQVLADVPEFNAQAQDPLPVDPPVKTSRKRSVK